MVGTDDTRPSGGVNLYTTTCVHGLDLRLVPRCYLCKPAPLDAERARHAEVSGQLALLTRVAQDVVRDAGTEKWPVNLDRLRMALDEIGALEPTDD